MSIHEMVKPINLYIARCARIWVYHSPIPTHFQSCRQSIRHAKTRAVAIVLVDKQPQYHRCFRAVEPRVSSCSRYGRRPAPAPAPAQHHRVKYPASSSLLYPAKSINMSLPNHPEQKRTERPRIVLPPNTAPSISTEKIKLAVSCVAQALMHFSSPSPPLLAPSSSRYHHRSSRLPPRILRRYHPGSSRDHARFANLVPDRHLSG